jgi:hypothetical protein
VSLIQGDEEHFGIFVCARFSVLSVDKQQNFTPKSQLEANIRE